MNRHIQLAQMWLADYLTTGDISSVRAAILHLAAILKEPDCGPK